MSGRTSSEGTLYDVLEVGTTATSEEIEASYQRIVSYLGPEALAVYSLMPEEEAQRRRRELDEAYRTLSNTESRAAYDRVRENSGYPQVLVPASSNDPTVSVGIVRTESDLPMPDVEAIFGGSDDTLGSTSRATRFVPSTTDIGDRQSDTADDTGLESDTALPLTPMRGSRLPPPSDSRDDARAAVQAAASPPVAARPSEPRPRSPRFSVTLGRGYEPLPASAKSAKPVGRRLFPSPAIEITPDTEFSGALLRRLRESCNGTIEDVVAITKIRRVYLVAIEEHAFDALPAPVYVRGFVGEYARVLGLDPQLVAQSYMALYRRYRGETV